MLGKGFCFQKVCSSPLPSCLSCQFCPWRRFWLEPFHISCLFHNVISCQCQFSGFLKYWGVCALVPFKSNSLPQPVEEDWRQHDLETYELATSEVPPQKCAIWLWWMGAIVQIEAKQEQREGQGKNNWGKVCRTTFAMRCTSSREDRSTTWDAMWPAPSPPLTFSYE